MRNAFQCKLIVRVEGQFPDFQSAFLFLDVVYLLVYLDKHGVVVEFLLVVLDYLQGTFLFAFTGSFILGKGKKRTALAEQLESPGFCRKHECPAFCLLVHFGFSDLGINVFHAMGELVVVFFHLGGNQQLLSQPFTFLLRELGKGMEVGFIVFHDGLVNEHVLNLTWKVVTFEYQEYQRLQEVLLLPEVQVILFFCYLERIHGDGLLLRVRNIGSLVVTTDTFIGITRIDHNHIRLLL